jgi:hypothetical protein
MGVLEVEAFQRGADDDVAVIHSAEGAAGARLSFTFHCGLKVATWKLGR